MKIGGKEEFLFSLSLFFEQPIKRRRNENTQDKRLSIFSGRLQIGNYNLDKGDCVRHKSKYKCKYE